MIDAQREPAGKTSSTSWFKASRAILLTVIVFLGGCACIGRLIARYDKLDHFEHFVTFFQPQWQFYPTVSEVVETVESLAPKDKILVLVGGNSIFRGTGQSVEQLWSKSLQTDLGDDYAVVNVAIDQAPMESFSGVVYNALRSRYPKRIYVGTLDERGFIFPSSMGAYEYFYWDAYYKGWIGSNNTEMPSAMRVRWEELKTLPGLQMHAYALADSFFYFTAIKNFIAYRIISPDWSAPASRPFVRRNWYVEGPTPNLDKLQQEIARDKARDRVMTERFTAFASGYVDVSKHPPTLRPAVAESLKTNFDTFFLPDERRRVLGVIISANPRYLDLLSPDAKQASHALRHGVVDLFRSQGYEGLVVGENYDPSDFVDQGHLMASGGVKMARDIAARVREISKTEGYLATGKH